MRAQDNVTGQPAITGGVALGFLGVLAFSFSLPATKLAVGGLDPWFVAFGRAAGAGALALVFLAATRASLPTRAQAGRLLLVALGIVVGFPLCTSLALVTETSAHGAVVIAGLPMTTAIFAVLRAGERPKPVFWLASAVGLVAVLAFVGFTGGLRGGFSVADIALLAAVVLAAVGYAEGGAMSRELGGAQTISWALVLALPVSVPITTATSPGLGTVDASAWLGFAYVTVVSMYLGFFAWYAGMARGGVARIGQVQLAQPVLTLAWSAVLLDERVDAITLLAALAVLACVVWTQRVRAGSATPAAPPIPPRAAHSPRR